jgi:squalene-hopene/tetraprenyl-beta-curcumene cyclase
MFRTLTLSLLAGSALLAADVPTLPTLPTLPTKAEVEALITKGQAWLVAQAQPNGAFVPGKKFPLGITQLATEALASAPLALPVTDPVIAKALEFQATFKQKDGGFYELEGTPNYTTALALKVFAVTKTGDAATRQAAQNFLFGIQNTDANSPAQGGIGYGSKGAGHEDLSNTAFAIEALKGSGVPASDARLQEALKFLEKCQNLSSVNKAPWVNNDGGAVYAPDESKAGGSWNPDQGTPQEAAKMVSYGSMTYALISSYLTLDVAKDDPRVHAALLWAKQNYQFDANPGMPVGPDKNGKLREKQGLFYYYGMMAKTFDLLDAQAFTLANGNQVDWRADLFRTISSKAIPGEGGKGVFWVNADAERWGEGFPHLTTCYMLKALKRVHSSL